MLDDGTTQLSHSHIYFPFNPFTNNYHMYVSYQFISSFSLQILTKMERHPTVKQDEKRSTKSGSKKTRPVKVVYISNPMKIKTSPSEFRAVVQQLTGRYATTGSITTTKDNQQQDCTHKRRSDLRYYESAGYQEDEVMDHDFINISQQMQLDRHGFDSGPD